MLGCCLVLQVHAQDTVQVLGVHARPETLVVDTLGRGKPIPGRIIPSQRHSARTAAFYSAVLPGLGQAYNHKYWKIPIAYAGLGVATGIFVYNYKQYILFRDAYRLSFSGQLTGNPFVDQYGAQDQKRIRDVYRQYVDYSALGFIGVYLINIVDAIVDAELYDFNVSNNLSLRLAPVSHAHYLGMGLLITLGHRASGSRQPAWPWTSRDYPPNRPSPKILNFQP